MDELFARHQPGGDGTPDTPDTSADPATPAEDPSADPPSSTPAVTDVDRRTSSDDVDVDAAGDDAPDVDQDGDVDAPNVDQGDGVDDAVADVDAAAADVDTPDVQADVEADVEAATGRTDGGASRSEVGEGVAVVAFDDDEERGDGDLAAQDPEQDHVDWRDALGADDADATMVLPLTGRDGVRHGDDTPREVWDTGTIRRWDSSMTDRGTATADSAMHRPYPLDDRDDVDLGGVDAQAARWYEVPLMILTALVLAFLLRTFVVQVFYIPSGSMIPTMEVYDRIAVEKLSYLGREPARGEVVVFAGDDPFGDVAGETATDRVLQGVGQFLGVVPVDAKDFVKRVIGLPGDTVVLVDGVVSVNDVVLDEPYALLDQDNGEWTVPEGDLFVMGDNRGNSGDSRSSLGYVPIDDVVGRAVLTLWPFDRAGSIPGVDHDAAVDAGS